MEIDQHLTTIIEKGLGAVETVMGEDIANRIRPIIYLNIEEGRLTYFLEECHPATPGDYVWRVANIYQQIYPYIVEVKVLKSDAVWSDITQQSKGWASRIMRKNGMYYSELFHRMLDDILTDSVIVMLEKRFPYDTGFMPWAYTILHYTTLKNIRAKFRLQNAPECSLEDFSPDSIYLKCNKSSDFAEQFAANAWFFWAIKTLTDKRKKVLYLRYVLNYSFNDIAQAMDKSENSVIQLHYQAIRQLRKWYE